MFQRRNSDSKWIFILPFLVLFACATSQSEENGLPEEVLGAPKAKQSEPAAIVPVPDAPTQKKPVTTAKKTKALAKNIPDELKLLGEVTASYREATLVEMSVEKRIIAEWKPKQDVSTGQIFYSHGKIRWEIKSPEKNWTIYDGKTWCNIEFASPDFPKDKNKVTLTSVDKKNKDQFFILALLDSRNPAESFKVQVKSNDGQQATLKLEPRKSSGFAGIEVVIEKKSKSFKQISFKDDIGNQTEIKLGAPEFKKEADENLFKYKPNMQKDQISRI